MIRLCKCRGGATSIEYSLLIGLVALLIVTALGLIGTKTAQPFNTIAAKL